MSDRQRDKSLANLLKRQGFNTPLLCKRGMKWLRREAARGHAGAMAELDVIAGAKAMVGRLAHLDEHEIPWTIFQQPKPDGEPADASDSMDILAEACRPTSHDEIQLRVRLPANA